MKAKKGSKQQGGAWDIAMGNLLARLLLWLGRKTGVNLKRLVFRWRRVLTPIWCGFAVYLIAVIWRALAAEWWPIALVLIAGGTTVAVLGPKLNDGWSAIITRLVPQGLDKGRTGVLDRMVERVYFAALWTAVGGYLAVRVGWGPSDFTLWWWRSTLLIFGGAWWYHRRVRVAGRADRIARKWNRIKDRDRCPDPLKAIAGSTVVHAYAAGRTTIMRVKLPEALTIDSVARLTRPLASFYKQRPNSVHVREDEELANHVWFTFLPRDPFKGKLPHPTPEIGKTSLRAMGLKLILGVLVDGTAREVSLLHHIGVYGSTGGGKSVFLHSVMRFLVACTDAMVVAIDMAGGATMNVWKKALALPVATTLEEACVLLEQVLAFVEDRERQLGNQADDDFADDFAPTDETPWLFLVMDEFPDLIGKARNAGMMDAAKQLTWAKYLQGLLDSIAKKARKCGVRIITGSQNGTKPDMGSKEFQAQLKCTISFGLEQGQSRNLWGTLERLGWSSTSLGIGQFLQRDPEHNVPERAKGWFFDKKEARQAAEDASLLVKMAEESAWRALMGSAGAHIVMPRPVELKDPVLKTLRDDGPMSAAELVEATGLSRATVYRKLNGHGESGAVEQNSDGKFVYAGAVEPVSVQADART